MDVMMNSLGGLFQGDLAESMLEAGGRYPYIVAALGAAAAFAVLAQSFIGLFAIFLFVPIFLFQLHSGKTDHIVTICALIVLLTVYSIQRRKQIRMLATIESEIAQIHSDVDRFLRALELRTRAIEETKFDSPRRL